MKENSEMFDQFVKFTLLFLREMNGIDEGNMPATCHFHYPDLAPDMQTLFHFNPFRSFVLIIKTNVCQSVL